MHINHPGLGEPFGRIAPDMPEDFDTVDGFARIFYEHLQQTEF